MNVASGCSAQDFELNLIDHACSVQLAKAAVCESPSVVTPPTPACSVPTQTYGKGLVCDVSVCEEHNAGQADDDCCGYSTATFCPAEYTKSKVLTSRVDATWLNAPTGFSRTCPNSVPYGGNTCCTPPPPPPPPPMTPPSAPSMHAACTDLNCWDGDFDAWGRSNGRVDGSGLGDYNWTVGAAACDAMSLTGSHTMQTCTDCCAVDPGCAAAILHPTNGTCHAKRLLPDFDAVDVYGCRPGGGGGLELHVKEGVALWCSRGDSPSCSIQEPAPAATFTAKEELGLAVRASCNNSRSAEERRAWLRSTHGPLAAWNVSAVEDIQRLFESLEHCNPGGIGGWDVSAVTNMQLAFDGAFVFNRNLNSWNVSRVSDMWRMFRDAKAFNSELNGWHTARVTTLQETFRAAEAFNQVINSWDVSQVTTMRMTFREL